VRPAYGGGSHLDRFGSIPGNWLCFPRRGIEAMSHTCPCAGWHRQGPRPWRWSCRVPPAGIGFVLPRAIDCTIHHRFFPAKHLPFFLVRPELALFVQHPTACAPGPAGHIGFVWRICPVLLPPPSCRPDTPARPGLASFRAFALRPPVPPGTAGNWLCFPKRGIEAMSHTCPRAGWHRQGRRPWRWSCRVPPAGIGFVLLRAIDCTIHHKFFPAKHLPLLLPWPELGLFGAIDRESRGARGENPIPRPRPGWRELALFPEAGHRGDVAPFVRPVPGPAKPGRIGFVLHNSTLG
jgi:hypothetical protein